MTMDPGEHFVWRYEGLQIAIGVTRLGSGPRLLLLPALSSISTRGEMRPLQDWLATRYGTIALDWPGFGDRPRPPFAWRPAVYRAFLRHVLTEDFARPYASIAAGHGAAVLAAVAAETPGIGGRLCLLAPTWRGPLPTMMGRRSALGARLAAIGDRPVLGTLLYRLNVNPAMVRLMARGHVYEDRDWLTPSRMADKRAVIAAPGARHASIRFVTGELDPFTDRASVLAAIRQVRESLLLVYGAHAPRRSRAEMEALAAEPHVRAVVLPRGKLGIHEEFPAEVAAAILGFLEKPAP